MSRAWVTLATNDSYGLGALVLAHSLRRAGSAYPTVVLITPSVTEAMRDRLSAVFAEVVTVDVLDSRDAAHLALLQRPELGITFTKIHCWSLTQYEKCVFLDADTLVIQNCDELFEREELSAAPDVGWPDCFNSGVFVFTPSAETFDRLIRFAQERGSFDGGDQGLLNSFFSDWAHGDINKHLPFLYNVTSAAFYSYLPALKHYGQNLKIIHFIGLAKPWLQQFNWESRTVDAPDHLRGLLQLWWDLFVSQVHSQLDVSMVEVEAPQHETTESPPELPPQDVSQQFHYQPVLDPESEFPWHHPDSQIQDHHLEQHIDMSEFHDPWDIYRGHIPPISDDAVSHRSDGKGDEREELRTYVWEYQARDYTFDNILQPQDESNNGPLESQCNEYNHRDSYKDNAPMCSQNHREVYFTDHHWQHEFHHEQAQGQQSFHSYQEQPSEPQDVYSFHEQTPEHWRQEQSYPEYPQRDNSQKNAETNQQHPGCTQDDQQQEEHGCEQHNNIHQHNQEAVHDYNEQNHCVQLNECSYNSNHNQFENVLSEQTIHNSHVDLSHHEQDERLSSVLELIHENNVQTDVYTEKRKFSIEQQVPTTSKNQEIVLQHVHVEEDKTCASPSNRQNHLGAETADAFLNGDVSDTDSEYEEIRPRHPYDGFYLRHRATIDSRGRKICTHEIPPTPSPSPSLSPELQDYLSAEDVTMSDCEDQSGVAGNFARVVLGSGGQRDAIDDLTRRQGWEAGNIDYMGVDSFDNIWAKISQTLSQPRSSPPKQSPPREIVAQPVPEQVEVQTGEVVQEPVVEPVEEAKEAVPVETPAAAEVVAPVEAPIPVDAPTPVEAPVAVETPISVEAPIPVDIPTAVETSVPVATPVTDDAPKSVEAPVPVEALPPVEAPLPVESPVVVEAPAPVAPSALVEVPEVIGAPVAASVELAAPAEIPVITKTSVPIDAPAPVDTLAQSEAGAHAEPSAPVEASEAAGVAVPVGPPAVTETTTEVTSSIEAPEEQIPVTVEAAAPVEVPSIESASVAAKPMEETSKKSETPAVLATPVSETAAVEPAAESPKVAEPTQVAPSSPVSVTEAPASKVTPEKPAVAETVSDSPPLANTPSKEEVPAVPAAQSAERRKPAGKLQLRPPSAADPLPTPDSELEDAAALAQSIIASELRTPTVTSPDPALAPAPAPTSPPAQARGPVPSRLSVEEPEVPTPPVGAVSLAQIGVKAPKGKSTTAAQIESSLTEKTDPETVPAAAAAAAAAAPPAEVPKKKVVKKVVKKEGASGAEAPVPPPRKKEKKPKEK